MKNNEDYKLSKNKQTNKTSCWKSEPLLLNFQLVAFPDGRCLVQVRWSSKDDFLFLIEERKKNPV